MDWLNYHHLNYFYVIATEQSVTKAGKKLRLAQSTLSAQLSQFEDHIGVKLFDRKGKKLTLTDMGHRVFAYAQQIFSLGAELQDLIRDRQSDEILKVQVGVTDAVPKHVPQSLLEHVLSRTGTQILVVEGRLEKLMRELASFHLDLVISNIQPPAEAGLKVMTKLVGDFPVEVVGAPRFAQLAADFPHSLSGVDMILPMAGSQLRREFESYLELRHVRPRIRAEVEDFELQKRLALAGLGITLMPLNAVRAEIASGQLIKISDVPVTHEKLWLISGQRFNHNPVAKEIMAGFKII